MVHAPPKESATRSITADGVRLTAPMVLVLIDHASGDRAVRVSEGETLRGLRARGLIRFNRQNKPSHSLATVRGRQVIAALLAQMAEAASQVDDETART